MANDGPLVTVTGIREVQASLKQIDPEARKELRKAMKAIAKVVVTVARGKMEFGPGPAMSSVRAGVSVGGGTITFPRGKGRGDLDYYPWLEFGGGRAEGRGVRPSGGRRDVRTKGRYVYPAIGESKGYIGHESYKAMERAAHRVSLKTEGF